MLGEHQAVVATEFDAPLAGSYVGAAPGSPTWRCADVLVDRCVNSILVVPDEAHSSGGAQVIDPKKSIDAFVRWQEGICDIDRLALIDAVAQDKISYDQCLIGLRRANRKAGGEDCGQKAYTHKAHEAIPSASHCKSPAV